MSWIVRNAIAVPLQIVSPETKQIEFSPKYFTYGEFSALQLWLWSNLAMAQPLPNQNILHCLEHRAHMGWLIDPDEVLIFVYRDDRTVAIFEKTEDVIPVPAFAGAIQLSVGQVFGWLED